jgi:hypothetical protein
MTSFLNNPDAVLDAAIEPHSDNKPSPEDSVKSIVRSIVQDANWGAAADDVFKPSTAADIANILALCLQIQIKSKLANQRCCDSQVYFLFEFVNKEPTGTNKLIYLLCQLQWMA